MQYYVKVRAIVIQLHRHLFLIAWSHELLLSPCRRAIAVMQPRKGLSPRRARGSAYPFSARLLYSRLLFLQQCHRRMHINRLFHGAVSVSAIATAVAAIHGGVKAVTGDIPSLLQGIRRKAH
jgi:hypothetical protein